MYMDMKHDKPCEAGVERSYQREGEAMLWRSVKEKSLDATDDGWRGERAVWRLE